MIIAAMWMCQHEPTTRLARDPMRRAGADCSATLDTRGQEMTRQPRTIEEWNGERTRLIAHIRALLRHPQNRYLRKMALEHLVEIFEDDGLEDITP